MEIDHFLVLSKYLIWRRPQSPVVDKQQEIRGCQVTDLGLKFEPMTFKFLSLQTKEK